MPNVELEGELWPILRGNCIKILILVTHIVLPWICLLLAGSSLLTSYILNNELF